MFLVVFVCSCIVVNMFPLMLEYLGDFPSLGVSLTECISHLFSLSTGVLWAIVILFPFRLIEEAGGQ